MGKLFANPVVICNLGFGIGNMGYWASDCKILEGLFGRL